MFAVLVNRSLSTAIGNKSLISHHIENLRPRFRLLHLGLLLLQGTLLTQPILRNVLRERVYHGALDYFRYNRLSQFHCDAPAECHFGLHLSFNVPRAKCLIITLHDIALKDDIF